MEIKRVLIINPFGVGDVLFTTPLIRHLKDTFKEIFIGFICNRKTEKILKSNKNINEVYVFEKDDYRLLWRKSKLDFLKEFRNFLRLIKSRDFDIAIDLSLGHQYAFFLMLLGVPVRLGYDFKGRGRFLTHKIKIDGYHDKHIAEYYLDLFNFLCKEFNIPSSADSSNKLEIFIDDADRNWADNFLKANGIGQQDKILVLLPGGGSSWGKTAVYKRWPPESFAVVADELAARHRLKVVILGSRDELGLCRTVEDAMRQKPAITNTDTDLLQLAAVFNRSEVVICNDGGPFHLAVAAGAKTVSLFGPTDENVYGPYPPSDKHIVIKEDIDCRPCYKQFKFSQCQQRLCLLNIRPQDVIKAAESLL